MISHIIVNDFTHFFCGTVEPLLSEPQLYENPSYLKQQSDSQTLKIWSLLTPHIRKPLKSEI